MSGYVLVDIRKPGRGIFIVDWLPLLIAELGVAFTEILHALTNDIVELLSLFLLAFEIQLVQRNLHQFEDRHITLPAQNPLKEAPTALQRANQRAP